MCHRGACESCSRAREFFDAWPHFAARAELATGQSSYLSVSSALLVAVRVFVSPRTRPCPRPCSLYSSFSSKILVGFREFSRVSEDT